MDKRLAVIIVIATALTACQKKESPIAGTPAPAPGTYVLMGQSNASRMGEYAGHELLAAMKTVTHDDVQIINCAVGGTSMESWSVSGVNYNNCLGRIKQEAKYEVRGILFWQGEGEAEGGSDGTSRDAENWAMLFTQMIKQFRAGRPIRVVFAKISSWPKLPYRSIVEDQQKSVYLPNCEMIYVDDIAPDDGLHYTASEYAVFARRFANAFK